jgi:hypothetical protein
MEASQKSCNGKPKIFSIQGFPSFHFRLAEVERGGQGSTESRPTKTARLPFLVQMCAVGAMLEALYG